MTQVKRGHNYQLWVVIAIFAAAALVVLQNGRTAHATPQAADAHQANSIYNLEPPSLSTLIAEVKPAVVSIAVEKSITPTMRSSQAPNFGGPDQEWLFKFFGAPNAPMPQPHKAQGQGSGFVVDKSGIIVTNYHVIEDADTITVIFESGDRLPAQVVGSDERTDLAVLKVNAKEALPYVEFGDSDRIAVGDWVVAIGNPFGFGGTATAGIISARGRDLQSGPYVDFIQIDAPINSGNSGGPVFDDTGHVVGINTAIYSPNGGNVGLGFAIPSSDAQLIVAELQDNGAVERGWLGVQIQDVDDALAESLGLDSVAGALVAQVVPGSPAADAGASVGDVIIEFNDNVVIDSKSLTQLVSHAETGEKVDMLVLRDGKRKALRPRISVLEDSPSVASASPNNTELGLEVAPLNESARNQLGIAPTVDGIIVVGVDPTGEGARQGIRRGDVISRVNQKAIHAPQDLRQAISDSHAKNQHQIAVLVHRGTTQQFVTLGLG